MRGVENRIVLALVLAAMLAGWPLAAQARRDFGGCYIASYGDYVCPRGGYSGLVKQKAPNQSPPPASKAALSKQPVLSGMTTASTASFVDAAMFQRCTDGIDNDNGSRIDAADPYCAPVYNDPVYSKLAVAMNAAPTASRDTVNRADTNVTRLRQLIGSGGNPGQLSSILRGNLASASAAAAPPSNSSMCMATPPQGGASGMSCGNGKPPVVKAFPTAEGFGAYATGGRGGKVCKVTTLNDSGPGSLRSCLGASGRRTIVFEVSGVINLKSAIGRVPNDVTVACQTAPGDGVMIRGKLAFYHSGTQNIIMRYCRFRPGKPEKTFNNGVSLGGASASNSIILDHISFGWSSDDMSGVTNLKPGVTQNVTIQWSIFSEALVMKEAALKGSGGATGSAGPEGTHVSWLNNLFTNVMKRTPHPSGGSAQIVNNVIQGNYTSESIYMLARYSPIKADIVNNWMNPPGNPGILTVGCGWANWTPRCKPEFEAATNLYVKGNVHTVKRPDPNKGSETAIVSALGKPYPGVQSTKPQAGFPVIYSQTDALSAKERVLANAGARVPKLDAIDQRAVNDVKNNTSRLCGKTVPVEKCATYPVYRSAPAPRDSDDDGMPDAWESQYGLDPNSAADGPRTSANGYTNLENYLNELAGDFKAPVAVTGICQSPNPQKPAIFCK